MTPRKNLRQRTSLKTSMKTAIIAGTAAVSGLVVLLLVVFNMTRETDSKAQSSMNYKRSEVIRDTSTVLRGSINQKIISVMIEASGKGSALKVSSMLFSSEGTSMPVENNIENARLWFTASNSEFMPSRQVGSTIIKMTSGNFEMECNTTLENGKNYFWLTYDIRPEAAANPASVNATCKEIRIGAIAYKPTDLNVSTKKFIAANIPYYSMGNFSVNNLNAWNSKRDGTGNSPRQLNQNRNSFFIQAGHKMISSTGSNLQTLVVENGGELKITAPLRLNTMYIASGGMVQQDASVTDFYCFNDFYMESGSSYIHNNTGYMPGLHCHFSASSNQVFNQAGSGTFAYNTKWGNVIMDITTPSDIDIDRNFTNVAGDFIIRKTGGDNGMQSTHCIFTGSTDTMNISGNFIIEGGIFSGMRSRKHDQLVVNIKGDLIVKGGMITDADSKQNQGATIMSIQGNVALSGGMLKFDNGSGSAMIFNGEGTSRWYQKPSCTAMLGNIIISGKREMVIKGDKLGDISAKGLLDVQPGSRLSCGSFPVTGTGHFMLQDNATLGIGHPDGISSTENKGNILTARRIYHSGANYCYYTGSTPQKTGVFITKPAANTVRRIILEKEQSGQTLGLSQDITVSEQVLINKGDIRTHGFDMNLPKISDRN